MNRIALLLTLCALFASTAITQELNAQNFGDQLRDQIRQKGRQMLEQELNKNFGQQQQEEKPKVKSMGGVPSESGNRSGGQDSGFRPGYGDNGFIMQNPQYPQHNSGSQNQNQMYRSYGTTTIGGMPSNPVSSSQYIMIRFPDSVSGSIRYTLTSAQGRFGYTISTGQEQRFPLGSGWSISYNDGVSEKRYRLEGGKVYTMKRNKQNRFQLYANK